MRTNWRCPLCHQECNVPADYVEDAKLAHQQAWHPDKEPVTASDWIACLALVGYGLVVMTVSYFL